MNEVGHAFERESGLSISLHLGSECALQALRGTFVDSVARWWGCAQPSTRGCGGGEALFSAESGYRRPEETRIPGRIRCTWLRQSTPR
jgi:hypothetical protein